MAGSSLASGRPHGVTVLLVGAALLVGACSREAAMPPAPHARDGSGAALHWAVPEVVLEPVVAHGAPIAADELVAALEDAAAAWNRALRGCPVPRLRVGAARAAGAARRDGRNVVVVSATSWCPADAADARACHEPRKQAITHVRPLTDSGASTDGEIVEADIEINAVGFRWSVRSGGAAQDPRPRSLRALLGHELGHVLGLDDVAGSGPFAARSIMYPDPTEDGRRLVPAPSADAVATLCAPSVRALALASSLLRPPRP